MLKKKEAPFTSSFCFANRSGQSNGLKSHIADKEVACRHSVTSCSLSSCHVTNLGISRGLTRGCDALCHRIGNDQLGFSSHAFRQTRSTTTTAATTNTTTIPLGKWKQNLWDTVFYFYILHHRKSEARLQTLLCQANELPKSEILLSGDCQMFT